jgi:hypothetical protein
VSGLTVAALADTPKVMGEGSWRLGVFIVAAASDEQAAKLGAVLSGALGGPIEAVGPLIAESLGVERAPIDVNEDVVLFAVETGQPVKLTGVFHPAGSELNVAKATRSKIDAFGIQYQGKAGFSTSRFSWAD